MRELAMASTAAAVITDLSFLKPGKQEPQNVLPRIKQLVTAKAATSTTDCPL